MLRENTNHNVTPATLPFGDYIINSCIGVEKKRAEDFARSTICNRLFDKISRLKK